MCLVFAVICVVAPIAAPQILHAQKPASVNKIIDRYLKAIGGKKRIAEIHDTVSEWTIRAGGAEAGSARIQSRAPGALKIELNFAKAPIISAANASSVWIQDEDGSVRTLTGKEASSLKLQALLTSSYFVDYKKSNVAAHVVALVDATAEPEFAVEFSTRGGGKLIYHFNRASGLLIGMDDPARGITTRFFDYRPEGGVLEPHEIRTNLPDRGEIVLTLRSIQRNRSLTLSTFDAPAAAEALNVPELLRIVGKNQDELEERFTEYSFFQKETDRELNSQGQLKKETSRVYEVFPIANREPVMKLISENGVPLTGERAAKEEKRVQEEFEKAERNKEKDQQKADKQKAEERRKRAEKGQSEDDDLEISQFLKVCEFISPRRERFRDRDAVVFDFRGRPGLKPSNRQEELISKLVGVVWIDPADKQVIRLEARLAEGFKMAGGLLLSLRPGAALVMEQTRTAEGIWLPELAQINLSVKVLLFGGGDINKTIEWSDYKHFSGDVSDYKIEAPKSAEPVKP